MKLDSKLGKHGKDALVGVALTAFLFLALELSLAALGLGGDPPPTRGFDPTRAYLVPDPEVPGGWRTQFNDRLIPDRSLPPRGDARRVLLFGGSNTEALPETWLQRQLNQSTPQTRFEVINLGRPGYGSERVAAIVEQAVRNLEPDVLVLYLGHNEFVERGFQMDVEEEWSSAGLRAVADVAAETRTVRWLTRRLGEGAAPIQGEPEAWSWEYSKFRDLPYEETLRYYDAYAENLRRMCRAARAADVRVVLCTVVHNRFSVPFESSLPPELDEAQRERFGELEREARALLPAFLAPLLPGNEQDRLHLFDWGRPRELNRGDAPHPPLPGRRACSGPFADRDPLLRKRADGWPEKVLILFEALERLHARALEPAAKQDLERAVGLLEEALAIAADHPRALFELALASYLLGRPSEDVRELFEDAARFDRAPRKANAAVRERVLEVAAAFPEALLVDVDALFSERMPMGLVGWEWMNDHCHLNLGAMQVMLEDVAQAIVARWYSGPATDGQ